MSEPTEPNRTVAAAPDQHASAGSSADETAPQAGLGKPKFGSPAAPGEVGILGPYRLVKELGKGGMGAVYLAVDTRLDRKLALKVMLAEFATDRDAKERFVREARAAAKITHDNVVVVYEADERDGVPYIAMQFLQGYPLDQYLKTKGMPALAHVIRIAREAALGLAAAHEIGLVHRDIKPGNLWLEAPNGRVKVLDFGLAKPVGTDAELTKSGAVVGTPAYMSPEQARGLKVDHRTDLFSLGAVLYRLCTGRQPFGGPNVMAVLMALGSDEPTPVRELNPNVPESLAQLIHQLLAKKSEQRPQTAAEVADRLRGILAQALNPSGASPAVAGPAVDMSASLPVVVHPLPVPLNIAPMSVTATPESVFAGLGDDTQAEPAESDEAEAKSSRQPAPREPKKGGKGVLIGTAVAALLAVGVVVAVVSQMGKKGAPTAEKGPEGPADAGKGAKGSGPAPKPPATKGELPPLPAFEFKPVPIGASPFDKLDANTIPKEERFDWQPKELVAVIGTHARKHWGDGVRLVAVSPDDKWAVTVNLGGSQAPDNQIWVWNLATRSLHAAVPLPEPDVYVVTVAFSPDSRKLYVSTAKGLVVYSFLGDKPGYEPWPGWEGKGGLFGPSADYHHIWFAPDGKTALVYTGNPLAPVQVWETVGAVPRQLRTLEKVGHLLGFTADRTAVIGARREMVGQPWEIVATPLAGGAGKVLLTLPPENGPFWNGRDSAIVVSSDGTTLAALDQTGGHDSGTLHDLTANPPKEKARFQTPGHTGHIRFLPDGKTLARTNTATQLIDVTQNPPKVRATIPSVYAGRAVYTSDGKTVVAADGLTVRFWDVTAAEPKEISPLPPGVALSNPHNFGGYAPVLATERGLLAVLHTDFRGQIWALDGPKPRLWPGEGAVFGHHPYAMPVATLPRDGTWITINDEVGIGARRVELKPNGSVEDGPKFNFYCFRQMFRDGRGVVQADDNAWYLWDMREPFEKAKPLPGVFGPEIKQLAYVAVRPDSKLLAHNIHTTDDAGRRVELWNLDGAKPVLVATLPGNYANGRAFSPDGRVLALVSGHNAADGVHLFDVSGKTLKRLPDLPTRTKGLAAVAFTPDAKRLATVSQDGHVELFDLATQARVWEAKLPGSAWWAEFAHDGRHLFTHNSNGTVYVLRLPDLTGAADRAAAEWAFSTNGGAVSIHGYNPAIQRAADLPAAFTLYGVYVSDKPVTDADLARLTGCVGLLVLALDGTKITDAGLEHLVAHSKLTALNVSRTKVTAAGVAKLAKALPNCKIQWDGGTIEPKK